MKKIAICGSYAYDVIMNFHDKFKNHILPDKVHMLNVAFLVPQLRREFGGCAGNIAYNCNLIGLDVYPVATVGNDFNPYMEWLKKCNINTDFIKVINDLYTAQAYITTDEDDNQITAFHPGAMNQAHQSRVMDIKPDLAIVAPDGKLAMIQHAQDLYDNKIPFIFDPGQGLPMFDKNELITFIKQATGVILNDYESEMLKSITNLSLQDIANSLEFFIITRGGKGAEVYYNNTVIQVPAIKVNQIVDPTGCGDSFRAGILYGLSHNLAIEEAVKFGNIIGGIKVCSKGTQNHRFSLAEIEEIYQKNFA